MPAPHNDPIELSIVMPCLNESDTLAVCVRKALQGIADSGVSGEVVVADNGSTDGSIEIAEAEGARVVHVPQRGYGNALRHGIRAAHGRWILMGDADDSYDFLEVPKFVAKIKEGHDLVQGCRLPWGGGRIAEGAMPWSHRWIGNPMFTLLARWWFGAPIHDVYCGMRAFTKAYFERLGLICSGMEFATEMIIKASLYRGRIGEVPITLHKDGRIKHAPHLRTIRDGWRTLRFYLLYTPRWLFLVPGFALFLSGGAGMLALSRGPLQLGRITPDVGAQAVCSMLFLLGTQAIGFAFISKTFAISEGFLPPDPKFSRLFRHFNLEKGLAAGSLLAVLGCWGVLHAFWQWKEAGFGDLSYAENLRVLILSTTFFVFGSQIILFSFLMSLLGLETENRKAPDRAE